MKAVIINKHGGPEALEYAENFPEPQITDNEVLVNIKARSLNRIEIVARNGYPGIGIPLPHILGPDGAGVVVKTGKSVKELKEGDRVVVYPVIIETEDEFTQSGKSFLSPAWKYVGLHRKGTYAEYIALPQSSLVKIPDNLSFEIASSLPTAGLTAYHGIKNVGQLKEGESFFIWGATGGVGTFAVQIAKSMGAKVIAATSKGDKVEKLYALGADHVINSASENVHEKVKEYTNGKGIDLILDYVGPATFPQSFEMVKKGGRIMLCGQLTGRETTLNIHMTYFRHISILGFYLGSRGEMTEFIAMAAEGKIQSVINNTLELKEMQKAHRLLESSEHFGKIVVI